MKFSKLMIVCMSVLVSVLAFSSVIYAGKNNSNGKDNEDCTMPSINSPAKLSILATPKKRSRYSTRETSRQIAEPPVRRMLFKPEAHEDHAEILEWIKEKASAIKSEFENRYHPIAELTKTPSHKIFPQ